MTIQLTAQIVPAITIIGTPLIPSDYVLTLIDAAVEDAQEAAASVAKTIKRPARATTTGTIALSGLQIIDGVSVGAGDRVLVKNQTTASQNGIYGAAAGAWQRVTDFDESADIASGIVVFVNQGSLNAQTLWFLTNADPIVLGGDSLAFAMVPRAPIQCAVTGSAPNNIELTPINASLLALVDSMEFTFTPQLTSTTAALPTINIRKGDGTLFGAKVLRAADQSFTGAGDLQKDKQVTVRLNAGNDCFNLKDSLALKQSWFGHGRVKLQVSGATTISLTQEDGQGVMI